MGRLWLTGASVREERSSSELVPDRTRPSTPLEISSKSSIHASCVSLLLRMRVVSLCARSWSCRSASASSASTAERLDWVDMDDCRSAFDISSACRLRSRRESR